MPKRLLVTGSRRWTDVEYIEICLEEAIETLGGKDEEIILVEGGAGGADKICADIWRSWKRPIETHRADWTRYGKAAGPVRNQDMVNMGADLTLGFVMPDSVGTLDCLRRSRVAGIPTIVYHIDS